MVPTGPGWLHDLKHNGMRVVIRKAGERVAILSEPGLGPSLRDDAGQ
jgi:hypothetical protein